MIVSFISDYILSVIITIKGKKKKDQSDQKGSGEG